MSRRAGRRSDDGRSSDVAVRSSLPRLRSVARGDACCEEQSSQLNVRRPFKEVPALARSGCGESYEMIRNAESADVETRQRCDIDDGK